MKLIFIAKTDYNCNKLNTRANQMPFYIDTTTKLPPPNIFQLILHYYRYLITIIVFCYKKFTNGPIFSPKSTMFKIFDFTIFTKHMEPLYCMAFPRVLYMLNNSDLTKRIFKHHRSNPDSIFEGNASMIVIKDLIQYMYKDIDVDLNDCILTCDKASTKVYHRFLQKYLSKLAMSSRTSIIESNINKYFSNLDKEELDATDIVNNYVCDNFTSMIFDKNYTTVDNQQMSFSECCTQMNQFVFNLVMDKKPYASDDIKYKQLSPALTNLKPIIDTIVDQNRELFDSEDFTLAQRRAMVFVLLFAGQETTNALIMYTIYKLSKIGSSAQNSIKLGLIDLEQATDYIFNVSLAECTPAYGIGRKIRTDVTIKDHNDKILHEFRAGTGVTMMQSFLAKNTTTDVTQDYQDYLPFGTGMHRCPGEQLVLLEVKMLIKYLLTNYNITTNVNEVEFVHWSSKKIATKFLARFNRVGT